MKSNSMKLLSLGLAAIPLTASIANAAITYDLRASASTGEGVNAPTNGGKSVNLSVGAAGTVTLQVWAQITSATAGNSIWGVSSSLGSIISSSTNGGVTGSLSVATPTAPFGDSLPVGGRVGVDISTVADSITDVGMNGTVASTNFIKLSKAAASSGTAVGGVFFATNVDSPVISTNQAVTNSNGSGFEFLLGTVTFTISNYQAGSSSLNWVIPAFTVGSSKGTRATWTDANNLASTGNGQATAMFVNTPVVFTVGVPEPTSFAMLMMGSLGLVGFRRPSFRRSA
jgi:PEP-CTERM motif